MQWHGVVAMRCCIVESKLLRGWIWYVAKCLEERKDTSPALHTSPRSFIRATSHLPLSLIDSDFLGNWCMDYVCRIYVHFTRVHVCSNRIIPKHINVRVEHVKPSKCRQDFLNRVKENEAKKKHAKETGERVQIARKVCDLLLVFRYVS